MEEEGWAAAARLYYELRREGLTVRSVIDCCIAGLALQHGVTLLHDDRDFTAIAKLRALKHLQFDSAGSPGFHEAGQQPLR
jgi:predicted nucleic acid-binding protein